MPVRLGHGTHTHCGIVIQKANNPTQIAERENGNQKPQNHRTKHGQKSSPARSPRERKIPVAEVVAAAAVAEVAAAAVVVVVVVEVVLAAAVTVHVGVLVGGCFVGRWKKPPQSNNPSSRLGGELHTCVRMRGLPRQLPCLWHFLLLLLRHLCCDVFTYLASARVFV